MGEKYKKNRRAQGPGSYFSWRNIIALGTLMVLAVNFGANFWLHHAAPHEQEERGSEVRASQQKDRQHHLLEQLEPKKGLEGGHQELSSAQSHPDGFHFHYPPSEVAEAPNIPSFPTWNASRPPTNVGSGTVDKHGHKQLAEGYRIYTQRIENEVAEVFAGVYERREVEATVATYRRLMAAAGSCRRRLPKSVNTAEEGLARLQESSSCWDNWIDSEDCTKAALLIKVREAKKPLMSMRGPDKQGEGSGTRALVRGFLRRLLGLVPDTDFVLPGSPSGYPMAIPSCYMDQSLHMLAQGGIWQHCPICRLKDKIYSCGLSASKGCVTNTPLVTAVCGVGRSLCGGIEQPVLFYAAHLGEAEVAGGENLHELRETLEDGKNRAEEFVMQTYMAILRRKVDESGLPEYRRNLLSGFMTEEDIKRILTNSDEHKKLMKVGLFGAPHPASTSELKLLVAELRAKLPQCGSGIDWDVCRGGAGHPMRVFDYVKAASLGALTVENAHKLFPKDIREVNKAIRNLERLYKDALRRYPLKEDLSTEITPFLSAPDTGSLINERLLASEERKHIEQLAKEKGFAAEGMEVLSKLVLKHTQSPANDVKQFNFRQLQLYWNSNGPVFLKGAPLPSFRWQAREGFVPIAMYVYNRPEYIARVLSALAKVKGISNCLLIASMDKVSQRVLDLFLAIEFMPVKIIVHPEPKKLVRAFSSEAMHGVLAIKEHWFFILSQVFEELPELQGYKEDALFLEEDHVPMPDMLVTLHALRKIKDNGQRCPGCFGIFLKWGCEKEEKEDDIYKACRVKWFTNTGLSFNRSVYQAIASSPTFDDFRDGWDWSVYHLIQTGQLLNCGRGCVPHMVAPAVSRIANIGRSGTTVKADDADSLLQLQFPTVAEDILDKGFNPDKIYLAPGFGHDGPTDAPLYLGFEHKHLGRRRR